MASASDLQLLEAVRNQNREAVRALLKQQVDVNAPQGDGATALHWAAHRDDLETADLLIRAGAKVNAATDLGVTPIALACANGSAAMVEKLLAAGANPNAVASGEPALMTAARTGSMGAVKALLARGADVNARDAVHGQRVTVVRHVRDRQPWAMLELLRNALTLVHRRQRRAELAVSG